ncbi:MFS transporter [Bacillota bacterium LX-D]|nr:MFS transporter [Bacillota bacterium LX-D]
MNNHTVALNKTNSSGFNFRILLLLSLGHLATDLNQGALPVILPYLKGAYDLSYAVAGLIPLVANISSSFIQPFFGLISDRFNCNWLLPIGCLAAAIGTALLGFANHYVIILLLILFSGLGVAAYHPEGAKVALYAAGGRKASAVSVFSVGGNFGYAFGSIIMAALLVQGGLTNSIYLLVPAIIVSFFLWVKMKDFPCQQPLKTQVQRLNLGLNKNNIGPLLTVIGIIIIRSWVQSGLAYYIPFYYINYLKTGQVRASYILFVFLLAGASGTLTGGPLTDRFGRKKVILSSMLLLPPLLLTFIYGHFVISLIALFVAGGVIVSTFSTTIVLGQELLPQNIGMASGLMTGFAVGTGGLGVTLLGVLADATSEHVAMVTIALLPLVGVLLTLLLPPEGKKNN